MEEKFIIYKRNEEEEYKIDKRVLENDLIRLNVEMIIIFLMVKNKIFSVIKLLDLIKEDKFREENYGYIKIKSNKKNRKVLERIAKMNDWEEEKERSIYD